MICAPRISQDAGVAALGDGNAHIEEFRRILASRRKLICERLDALPQVFQYTRPEGAYYVFPRIVARHKNSNEFSLHLLGKAHVSVTPGSAFGPSSENHVRMAYCVDEDVIDKAFDRIDKLYPGWLGLGPVFTAHLKLLHYVL